MRLLPVLAVLALIAVPGLAAAEPLFCYWVESSPRSTKARALGQDGRVREFSSDRQSTLVEALRSLERSEPSGDPVQPILMARLQALASAASKGPYRDDPTTRSLYALPDSVVACLAAMPQQTRPVPVILRECHNSSRTNVAPSAPELMTYLTHLLDHPSGKPSEAETIVRTMRRCW